MYISAGEVVREALRLLEEQPQLRATRLARTGRSSPGGAGRPNGSRSTPTSSRLHGVRDVDTAFGENNP